MKRIVILLILILPMFGACASSGDQHEPLSSSHKLIAISTSKHWRISTDLDPAAELQLARKDQRAFLLAYAYDKNQESYPGLRPFAKLATETLMQGLERARAEIPVTGNINGMTTVIYALVGERDDTSYFYFSATIEGQHAIYWVIAWCPSEDYNHVGDNLVDTLFGIREQGQQ